MLPRDTGNALPLFARDLCCIFMVFLGCMDGLVALGFCFCTGTVARCVVVEIDINGKEPNPEHRNCSRDHIKNLILVSFALRVLLGHELCETSTVFSALKEVPNIFALKSYCSVHPSSSIIAK
jgi:hypothetical protein